jgi:hypothetical protein
MASCRRRRRADRLRGALAGPGLLAHVLVSKYCDHLPLYRQSEIYGRKDVELERSTLADWVGGSAHLLEPLVEALRRYVTAASKLHATTRCRCSLRASARLAPGPAPRSPPGASQPAAGLSAPVVRSDVVEALAQVGDDRGDSLRADAMGRAYALYK